MRQLPAGTVTTLFTDIEGSTRLLQELGRDRYLEHLRLHREVLRAAFERHGGVEVEMQGDSFHFSFPRASDAVVAASEAQQALAAAAWPYPEPIRVRIGLHTGEPATADGLYVGIDIHRAARVMSAGHGGQTLVSESTEAVVREELPDGLKLRDLGAHRLKGLSAPMRLFQVGDGEFPPLNTLYQSNLPVQANPLVGREREAQEVVDLVRRNRLVTLTGPGGTGKTHLGLHVAAELAADFTDGVWFVALAAVSDPELVGPTVASVVGARDDLDGFLRGKHLLLVLDNFEHLLAAAPAVVGMLAAAPRLRVLVTSRARLAVSGEQEYPLPPLVDEEAHELFETRARALRPDFSSNGAVAEICTRLDGLPLAIELAAARVKVLTPRQILERLEHRLEFLTGGARDAPERQRTLRATIEWSYELLDERERVLLARLAVFAGSFELEAAEKICECDLDTLASLVDKSLVRQTAEGRFVMLDTIAEFGLERLAARDEVLRLRERHASYFAELAQTARPYVKGPQQLEWLHRLDAEHSNIRAALRHFIDTRAGDSALRTCFALKEAWDARARYTEARRWLLEARGSAAGAAARACGDAALGLFAFRQGDIDVALDLETSAAAAFEQHGMLSEQVEATSNAGFIQMILGRTDESVALGERALGLARESGDAWMTSWTLNAVACAYYESGRRDLAWELLREAVRVGHEIGDRRLLIPPLSNLGEQATAEGKLDDALRYTVEAIELARAVGDVGFLSNGLLNIGMVHLFRGDLSGVAVASHEAIDLALDHGIRPPLVEWMFIAAAAFAVLGARERAVRLWSAGQANLVGTFDVLSPIIRSSRQKFLEPLRDQLDRDTFDAAWDEGSVLTLEDAAREARQIGDLT